MSDTRREYREELEAQKWAAEDQAKVGMTLRQIFNHIRARVARRFPRLADVNLKPCRFITEDIEHYRVFMHTYHHDGVICYAKQASSVPAANQEGLIWHEFGHLIAGPDGDECDADWVIYQHFGLEISYDDTDLQYIKARTYTSVPKDMERFH